MVMFNSYVKLPEGSFFHNRTSKATGYGVFQEGVRLNHPAESSVRLDGVANPSGIPICSMYGTFTYICPNNHPNVGEYTIHGAYGIDLLLFVLQAVFFFISNQF